jgi:membrane protease subunit HflK
VSETPNEPTPREDGLPLDGAGGPAAPARSASVQLRDEGDTEAAMMDPANQSLADALRITFVLVQVAMIVLAALFVFSGFQTVREGERGLSVLFGRAVRDNLEPGFHFSAPYPFGELVKIGTGNESAKVLRDFWPYTSEGREEDSVDRLSPRARIDPERDGSLITADLNLAHTQWQAVYRRTDPIDFVKNILPEEEEAIVRSALRRGVVRTMSETTIDDLLRPQSGGTRLISQRALQVAQETLDAMDAGITIEQFELGRKTPPIFLLSKFQAVLDARSEAQQAISTARTERDSTLNGAAGEAAPALLWLIGKYELMLEVGDRDGAAGVLTRIDSVLAGEPFVLSESERAEAVGTTGFPGLLSADGRRASGAVVETISAAEVEALTRVQEAQGDLDLFRAKLAQYRANPTLMVSRDWSAAFTSFQSNDFVQTMLLPVHEGVVELWINEDPDIVKELDRALKQRQRQDAAGERMEQLRRRQYQGDRGILIEDK